MHLNEIAQLVAEDTKREARKFTEEWGPDLLRGVIDQRIKHKKKLFVKAGEGRYGRCPLGKAA